MAKRKIPRYNSQEYWKTANEYRFEGGKKVGALELYAHSSKNAMLKKTNHNKWLVKRGFKKSKYTKLYAIKYKGNRRIKKLVRRL